MQQNLFDNHSILPHDGEVLFFPAFFEKQESDFYLHNLTETIPWKQEPIKIFGKEVMQPRLTSWHGDKPYTYSGITMHPHPWTDELKNIKTKIEGVAQVAFNSVLLNLYRNGQDSMGWHRDNEKELGGNPVIGSVSLGATRTFKLRNYRDKKEVVSVELTHGSFLLMKGPTQHFWEHHIPKTSKVSGPRINLTFRIIR